MIVANFVFVAMLLMYWIAHRQEKKEKQKNQSKKDKSLSADIEMIK